MVTDARCRCGRRLRFQRGEAGYKTRCPACRAVVRLRKAKRQKQRTETVSVSEQTPCPTKLPPPLPMLSGVPPQRVVPEIDLKPVAPSVPVAGGLRLWTWPVWLASAAALALVVLVLLLVRRS